MKQELVSIITNLIREKGYASLSIAEIGEATNLNKSSLYHHFPGGKVEMAQMVLEGALSLLGAEFGKCLQDKKTARQQLIAVINVLDEFYEGGEKNCLVDVMSVAPSDPMIQKSLDKILTALLTVFADILKTDGSDKKTAEREAVTIVSLLQGGLVLARAAHNPKYFKQATQEILKRYCVTG